MKRSLHVVVLVALFAGIAVSSAWGKGKPPSGPAVVSLIVTFDDDPSNNIRSDGLGAYVDGEGSVVATLDETGNFVIRDTGARSIYYEFDVPLAGTLAGVDGTPDDPAMGIAPAEAYGSANQFITLKTGAVALQNMAVGTTDCLRIAASFASPTEAGVRYRTNFQRTQNIGLSAEDDNTDWGIITRVDADTWTVESGAGPCGDIAEDAEGAARVLKIKTVRNKTTITNLGRFDMPFKMTLTRKL